MNERIRELAEQASEIDGDDLLYYHPVFAEKFAELIVRECVRKCEFVAGQAEITNTGEMARKTKTTANNCAFLIKEHFGVK